MIAKQPYFTDDVCGQIIGSPYVCGILVYRGRQQGPTFYSCSDDEIVEAAKKYKQDLFNQIGVVWPEIYPETNAWEVRIAC